MKTVWIEHAEGNERAAPDLLAAVVQEKELGVRTELDGLLRVHRQRAGRVDEDVHNVRMAELALHRDRISRHSKVVAALCVCVVCRGQMGLDSWAYKLGKSCALLASLSIISGCRD